VLNDFLAEQRLSTHRAFGAVVHPQILNEKWGGGLLMIRHPRRAVREQSL
jgi:hypothetical protein